MFATVKIIKEKGKRRRRKGVDERIRGGSEGSGVRYTTEGREGAMSWNGIEN